MRSLLGASLRAAKIINLLQSVCHFADEPKKPKGTLDATRILWWDRGARDRVSWLRFPGFGGIHSRCRVAGDPEGFQGLSRVQQTALVGIPTKSLEAVGAPTGLGQQGSLGFARPTDSSGTRCPAADDRGARSVRHYLAARNDPPVLINQSVRIPNELLLSHVLR